jgi:hypothetical protein
MKSRWRPFASYNLWSLFAPSVGQELFHCPMKRGFLKARKKEPDVARLINRDTVPQAIGLFAQHGVYEFHQNPQLLKSVDGVFQIADLIHLGQQVPEVESRVLQILTNYQASPILVEKKIMHLLRGDEGPPELSS